MSEKNLYKAVQKLAHQEPSLRKYLVPLLRKYADCGDEMMGGRTWDGDKSQPDDGNPYNKHPKSPPAGANGSPQRAEYNKWYRENVCPKHKTNCGL